MASLFDLLLLPPRLAGRALDDVHRIAEAAGSLGELARALQRELGTVTAWMRSTGTELTLLREQAEGIRAAIEPMSHDVTVLRDEFGRSNDEIARLREAFHPQLAALRGSAHGMLEEIGRVRQLLEMLDGDMRDMGNGVNAEMHALDASVRALVRDADEISEVVEPLQAATKRVGRVADRLPGTSRRRS